MLTAEAEREEKQMDQKKIGNFIAKLRKEKGMTQRELADILCVSDKTVSKWECGNSLPEITLLELSVKHWTVMLMNYCPEKKLWIRSIQRKRRKI